MCYFFHFGLVPINSCNLFYFNSLALFFIYVQQGYAKEVVSYTKNSNGIPMKQANNFSSFFSCPRYYSYSLLCVHKYFMHSHSPMHAWGRRGVAIS